MTISPFSEFSHPFFPGCSLVKRPLGGTHTVRQVQFLQQVVVDRQAARPSLCDDGLYDLRRYLLIRYSLHRVHLCLHLTVIIHRRPPVGIGASKDSRHLTPIDAVLNLTHGFHPCFGIHCPAKDWPGPSALTSGIRKSRSRVTTTDNSLLPDLSFPFRSNARHCMSFSGCWPKASASPTGTAAGSGVRRRSNVT